MLTERGREIGGVVAGSWHGYFERIAHQLRPEEQQAVIRGGRYLKNLPYANTKNT